MRRLQLYGSINIDETAIEIPPGSKEPGDNSTPRRRYSMQNYAKWYI